MGYYSDVAFTIRGKKDEVIAELLAYRLNHGTAALNECSCSQRGENLVMVYKAESVKWHDQFDDVRLLMKLYYHFSEDYEERFDCAFLRIGEESEDIEQSTSGADPHDLVQLERSIGMMYPFDPENTFAKLMEETHV